MTIWYFINVERYQTMRAYKLIFIRQITQALDDQYAIKSCNLKNRFKVPFREHDRTTQAI